VRVQGAPGIRVVETFATADEANSRVLELRRMRKAGLLPGAPPLELTLREACDRRERAGVRRAIEELAPDGLRQALRFGSGSG